MYGNHVIGCSVSSSAKCKLVRQSHVNLPDTPVNLTSASKYFQMLPGLVSATVLACHFGSGSEPNRSQIGGPGRHETRTVNLGMVQSTSPYPSELGGFPACCSVGPSVNTYNMLVFAI